MDAMMIPGLPPASIQVIQAERASILAAENPDLFRQAVPVDAVEIGLAVQRADGPENPYLNPDGKGPSPNSTTPSLRSILEAIREYLEEALSKAREANKEYFQDMKALGEELNQASGSQNLNAAAELVAATEPEAMETFGQSAQAFVSAIAEKDPSGSGKNTTLSLSDIGLLAEPSGQDTEQKVMLNGFKLTAEIFQTESQTMAKISLTAKAGGDFQLSTTEAKTPEG